MSTDLDSPGSSPLEEFLRDYVETTGGVWDEIEPQVYDLMLPGREPARASRRWCAWSSTPRRCPSIPAPSSPASARR